MTLWIEVEKNVSRQHKNRHFCFSFCWRQVLFRSQFLTFHPAFSINIPLLGNHAVQGPPCGGSSRGQGRLCLPPSEWREGFREVSFSRQLKTPDGIARRVPGVWVLSFPKYFNCCPAFLNTLKFSSPSGVHCIFMSRKGNSSFVIVLTLSSFAWGGGFSSGFQISAVNWRVFAKVSFARRLKTPDGIARRVPGVWVLSFPKYFNCCFVP